MNPALEVSFSAAAPGDDAAEPAEALAFGDVYEAHVRFVWRTLRRLGVADSDCDDAVQDVFLVVHRKLGDFRPEAPIKHWLFRLAASVARDHRRSRKRKDPREHGLIPVPSDDEVADIRGRGPAESAERLAAQRLIRELLQELEPSRREVFILADLEQMTAAEIAQVLEIPLNTAYSRLRRARQDFEEALTRHRQRDGKGEAR